MTEYSDFELMMRLFLEAPRRPLPPSEYKVKLRNPKNKIIAMKKAKEKRAKKNAKRLASSNIRPTGWKPIAEEQAE